MAPLLLEVATGELRHQPNLVGVVGVITAGLASRVVPRLRTRGKAARPAARRVVDAAMVGLLRPDARVGQLVAAVFLLILPRRAGPLPPGRSRTRRSAVVRVGLGLALDRLRADSRRRGRIP